MAVLVTPPLALYVHFPWCVRKCPYCDFNSYTLNGELAPERYVARLARDIEAQASGVEGREVISIFFGGGTPSLFPPESISRVLQAARRYLRVTPEVEVTLEANPGAIERGAFQEYHAAGVSNFNLDLMYGLPGQWLAGAVRDVDEALALEPAHLSHYQLTLEPGTVFAARPPPLPDEDSCAAMLDECRARLSAAGFAQYEVSAYARPGAQCRHNLNYWTFGDYLGAGAGAHGKLTCAATSRIVRTTQQREPRRYLASADEAIEQRTISPQDLPFEFMLNALRLTGGFDKTTFNSRTGLPWEAIAGAVRTACAAGLLLVTAEHCRPSAQGQRFLNDLLLHFLPETTEKAGASGLSMATPEVTF